MYNDNSPKIFFKHFFIFYIKVAVIHTLTYIFFGIFFSNIFNYREIYENVIVSNFMRGFESPLTVIGPFLQPIRAVFIAIALFPIRKIIITKFGWFIVWLIFVCIGIIAAPSAAPTSIEGLIYNQLPIEFHLINLPELFLQTFSFSVILWIVELLPHSEKKFSNRVFLTKILFSIIFTMAGIFLTSVCGIIIMNFLELDYTNAKLDRGTISYLSTISILTIIISYSFSDKSCKNKLWLLLIIPLILLLYILFPYGYNYLFNTVYNNKMALIPYSISAVLMSIIYYAVFIVFYGRLIGIGRKSSELSEKEDNKNKEDDIKLIDINQDNSNIIEINPDDNTGNKT